MFAAIAAVLFAIALLCEFLKTSIGSITVEILTTAGLLFFALHFAYTTRSTYWKGSRR